MFGKEESGEGAPFGARLPGFGNLVAARAVAAGTTGASASGRRRGGRAEIAEASAFAMAARLGDELFRGFGAAGRAYRIFVAENKFFKFMTAARATVFKHGHDASPVNVFSQAWA